MTSQTISLTVPEHIRLLKPYIPGKPLAALAREYGITDSVKLSSNENPLGPSPKAMAAVRSVLAGVHRYPDDGGYELIHRLATHHSLVPEAVVLGNGSDELLTMLARAFLHPGDIALIPQPSFLVYELVTRWAGAECQFVPLKNMTIDLEALADQVSDRCRMVFLCNPNNPTGTVVTRKALEAFLDRIPEDLIVVMDEAYGEFVRADDCPRGIDYLKGNRPIVILHTFSKIYGLAGLRIGYGLMPPEIAAILQQVRIPFNVNSLAQAAAVAALEDTDFTDATRRLIALGLAFLARELGDLGIRYFPTETNFFLIDVGRPADEVYEQLLRQGVIVRPMTSYGYPQYIRVNVGLHEENERLIWALSRVLCESPKGAADGTK